MSDYLTIDDLLDMRVPSDAQQHPHGKQVAYTIASATGERDNRRGDSAIWLAVPGRTPLRLTGGGAFARHPRWSPDGDRLAFTGRRKGQRRDQVFILDDGWGEARQVGTFKGGIRSFAWEPSGASIAVLVNDPAPADEEERREEGRDWIEYEQHPRYSRLWNLQPETGDSSLITETDLHVYEYTWSPDGSQIAAIVADQPFGSSWYGARLVIIDVANGEVRDLYVPERQIARPAWSPNGQHIALITCTFSDEGMTGGDIILIDAETGQGGTLTEGQPRSFLVPNWESDGRGLLCAAVEMGMAALYHVPLEGNRRLLWGDTASIGGGNVSRSADGARVAMVMSTPTTSPDVWQGTLADDRIILERLTETNPDVEGREAGKIHLISWESSDDRRIHGLIYRPRGVAMDERLPMITIVHGGPTGVISPGFPDVRSMGWAHLLAAKGYMTFMPNFRGSMGFGVEFAELNNRDLGGGDLEDVLTGIDFCVEHGLADPERLGICGWSYGGYLTPWAITQTPRFKAAVSGASITNWTSFHGRSTIQGWDETFNRADPYNADGYYTFRSPVYNVAAVETPTLFVHGERDPICPVEQSYEMWRALKDRGVEAELVVYPREEHGFREREHVRNLLERLVAWFTERV